MNVADSNPAETTEIVSSPAKHVVLALGGIVFVALGVWLLNIDPNDLSLKVIGSLSILFFGAMTGLIVWRLLTQRGTVITLTPQGFHDIRVTKSAVPWNAVEAVSVWSSQGQASVIVKLKPGEEQKLELTTIARMTRKANAALGADGLALTAQGTKISHDALLSTIIGHCQRYTQSV